MTVIAIDFGTKYSSVAARLQNGWIYPLADDHGQIRISSCVAFYDDGVRVGNLADLKRHAHAENTIFDIKTLLGLSFERADALKEKYNWPFKVVPDKKRRAKLEVHYLGSTVSFYPEEILAIFLNQLVRIAEKRLGPVQVSGAVITVPSSFNHLKRKAIINAARIAKIDLKALVNDTTAAAIYYSTIPRHALKTMIIHVGAGSLAVSICHITDYGITVKFTSGESSLGGEDINRKIIHDMKLSSEVTNLHKLIEEVKISFCQPNKMNNQIELEYGGGKKEMKTIWREAFEQACSPILHKLKSAILQSLKWCQHNREEVSKVILIGGSTRLLLVEQLLSDLHLHRNIEMTGIKTDEIVLLGAGMLAVEYVKSDLVKSRYVIKDVLTYSVMDIDENLLVAQNTPLSECQRHAKPVKCEEIFKIIEANGNVVITAETLTLNHLKFAITITDDGLISLVTSSKFEMADGLSDSKIDKLIRKQNELNQGTAGREALEKEKYQMEKQALDVKKEMKKIWKKCDAAGELVDKKPDLSLADVQRERREFRVVFLRGVENMNAIMRSEEEILPTDDYRKKLENLQNQHTRQIDEFQRKYKEMEECNKSLVENLEIERKRCESLQQQKQQLEGEREQKGTAYYLTSEKPTLSERSSQTSIACEQRPLLYEAPPISEAREFPSGSQGQKREGDNSGSSQRRMPWDFILDWFASFRRRNH